MTTSIPNQTRLFGMDLSQWPMQWRAAGAMLLGLPALRGLTPPVRVDLLRADGGRSFWDVAHGRAQPAAPGAGAALLAVELPRDQVLDRQFTLPRLTPADVARAVRLEVDAATPFDPEQTVFGYAATPAGDTLRIDLAMASRAHVERRLQSVATGQVHRPEASTTLPCAVRRLTVQWYRLVPEPRQIPRNTVGESHSTALIRS